MIIELSRNADAFCDVPKTRNCKAYSRHKTLCKVKILNAIFGGFDLMNLENLIAKKKSKK